MANEQLAVVKVHSTGSITSHDVLDALSRRSHLWLSAIALWAVLIGLYVAFSPSRYEAETVLLVKNGRADLVLSPDQRAMSQADQKESQIATEIELLSQQDLLRKVARNAGMVHAGTDVDDAVRKLRKNLEITPVFKADLIRIKFTANNREQATRTLSTLLNAYMDRHLELHHSGDAFPFFDQQTETSKRELKAAEERLAAFESRTGIVLMNDQKEAAVKSIADLQAASRSSAVALNEATREKEMLAKRRAGLQARITTQTRRIPNQYSVERLNTMLTELQNKRTDLLTKFRPDNRLVKEADQEIANTQAALSQAQALTSTEEATDVNPLHQAVERDLAAAEVSAETARIRHEVVNSQIQQQQREMTQLDSATTEHDNLMREVKRLEENYRLYSGKREEARISDAMDKQKIANVVVAETPVVPTLPKPKLSGGLAGVFLLGCAVILAGTFAAGGRRRTFDTAWELESYTVMPVLATVEYSEVRAETARQRMTVSARDHVLSGGD